MKKVTELNDNLESKKKKKAPAEKHEPRTVQFVIECSASRSLEKTQATIQNPNNEQDPSFVLSE